MAHEAGIINRFGATVVAAFGDGAVTVEDEHGTEQMSADLVVAADGTHSVVRSHGAFAATARPTGTTYVPVCRERDGHRAPGEFWTPLGLFGGAPLGDGTT